MSACLRRLPLRQSTAIFNRRQHTRDIGQPTPYTHPHLLKEGEILPGMHKSEFLQRRRNLMREIASTRAGEANKKHLVIVPGAPVRYMSNDVPYRFHQSTDLLYMTGFQEPDAVLLLESTGGLPDHKSILYVRPRDPHRELWDGPRAGPDGATAFTGVTEAYNIDTLGSHLEQKYSKNGYSVWYCTEEYVHPDHDDTIVNSLTNSPESHIHSVHTYTQLMHKLRSVKSPAELNLMRTAGQIASSAFRETMRLTRPDMMEYQLESIFEHHCKMNGAQILSFPPVVAGGSRANCLHYIANNRELRAGDLVLFDAGCEYHGYVSDITRTWPIGGQFTAAQKELYESVLRVKQASIKSCRAGETLSHLNRKAANMLCSELQALGLIARNSSASESTQAINKLFPHHLGHFLGMDTHDTTTVDRDIVLSPGMVITIEPGVYVPKDWPIGGTKTAKELLGTGIRIEDDVVITENGCEVLNANCPQTVEEITELRAGMGKC